MSALTPVSKSIAFNVSTLVPEFSKYKKDKEKKQRTNKSNYLQQQQQQMEYLPIGRFSAIDVSKLTLSNIGA